MSPEPSDWIRAAARRAAGRALAGQRDVPAPPPPGVEAQVVVRPMGAAEQRTPSRGPVLVSADCLGKTPDGGTFALAPGARLTPSAQDEAWRRRIRFVSASGVRRRANGDPDRPRVALGSDHGGFELKGMLKDELASLGYTVEDVGTHDQRSCDYPDFAAAVAEAVSAGRAEFGVLVDGAGIGSAMAANKVPGVLAANCFDERTAVNAREHNHANVLCLGAGGLRDTQAVTILRRFLATPVGPDRHARRVQKIFDIEGSYARRLGEVRP